MLSSVGGQLISVQFACHGRLIVDHQKLRPAQRFRDKRNERARPAASFGSIGIRQ
jgi:hypothetical protein